MKSQVIIGIQLHEYGIKVRGLATSSKYLMSQCSEDLIRPFNIKDEFAKRTEIVHVNWTQTPGRVFI